MPMQTTTAVPLEALSLTRGVAEACAWGAIHPAELTACLLRHRRGDWGDVDAEGRSANDWSLANGERLFSAYRVGEGVKVWVITERARSATTVLFPDEY